MQGKYTKKRKNRFYKAIGILLAICLTATGTGVTLARYRKENIQKAEMIAAGFHVSSDYLVNGGATYTIPNSAPFLIQLHNYETENVALISEVEVTCQVEVTNGYVDEQKSRTKTEIKLAANTSDTQELTIYPDGSGKDITVKVTTAPFNFPMSATFQLLDLAEPTMDKPNHVIDNGDHYVITIHSGQYSGEMTLTWSGEGLLPDYTNPLMRDWSSTQNKRTFTAESYSTYELIFFNPKGSNATFNLN